MKFATGFAVAAALTLGLGIGAAQAGGDAAKGEKVFKKCKACHTIEDGGKHKAGPNLFGIVGKKAGSTDFKKYSGLKGSDVVWTEENLDKWLTNPKKFIGKKTSMVIKIKKPDERMDVIEYLKTQK
jgi:cytochrome c